MQPVAVHHPIPILPNEVLEEVLRNTSVLTLVNLSQCSRALRNYVKGANHVWMHFFMQRNRGYQPSHIDNWRLAFLDQSIMYINLTQGENSYPTSPVRYSSCECEKGIFYLENQGRTHIESSAGVVISQERGYPVKVYKELIAITSEEFLEAIVLTLSSSISLWKRGCKILTLENITGKLEFTSQYTLCVDGNIMRYWPVQDTTNMGILMFSKGYRYFSGVDKFVLFACHNKLRIYDLSNGSLKKSVFLPEGFVIFEKDVNFRWFLKGSCLALVKGKEIYFCDLLTSEQIVFVSALSESIDSSQIVLDNKYLYILTHSTTIVRVNLHTKTLDKTYIFNVGRGSYDIIRFIASGNRLFVVGKLDKNDEVCLVTFETESEKILLKYYSKVGVKLVNLILMSNVLVMQLEKTFKLKTNILFINVADGQRLLKFNLRNRCCLGDDSVTEFGYLPSNPQLFAKKVYNFMSTDVYTKKSSCTIV
jgi:hypothetical protein